jgi:hyperosmotically inducible protein
MRSKTAKIWTAAAVAALFAAPIAASANPIGDAWITTKVKMRLIREPGIAPLKVNVDTSDGFVTLKGAVTTEDGKREAARQAMMVGGVKSVANELRVEPKPRA